LTEQRFSFWREELKRAWLELRGPGTTPGRAALSVALGLFIGSLPIFGCHTPLILVFCIWLQLDAAIAWVVSNVSNPFFAPALLTAEVQIGAWLRTGSRLQVHQELARGAALRHFVGYMFLGAPIAGLALAMSGAAIAYAFVALRPKPNVRRYQLPPNAPEWVKAVERVAARFASPYSESARERTRFHYLRTKLLGDPVAKLLADVAGSERDALGALLDVGTGRGQLPLLLIELGCAASVRGVDWDAAKIADAERAVAAGRDAGDGPLDAVFVQGDVRTAPFAPADTVLLIDILHYFSPHEQDAILDRAAGATRPNGRLFVREADTARGWRSWATLAEERLATLVRWHRGERVRFRSSGDITRRLEAAGFRCTVRPAWGKTPFSNVLVVGQKPVGPLPNLLEK
jgi:uncharacterized protein (DUF2062 family)/SAM-dependent methyltransferase